MRLERTSSAGDRMEMATGANGQENPEDGEGAGFGDGVNIFHLKMSSGCGSCTEQHRSDQRELYEYSFHRAIRSFFEESTASAAGAVTVGRDCCGVAY